MMDVLKLPFDQYQRYRLVTELLASVRTAKEPLSILDVGGRTALLRSFLPDDRVTLVDVEPSKEKGLVLGTGSALPFADRTFDAVCAFDTLEHVPRKWRTDFVAECRRVSKRWVLIAGPYKGKHVDRAEELLQQFLREKLGVEHRYLEEHRTNRLPVRKDVEEQLAAAGGAVHSYGHGNVHRWLALMAISMYFDQDADLRGLAKELYRYYNKTLYENDTSGPVYRHVIVGAFDGAPLPELAEPAEGLGLEEGPVPDLAFDLMGFDRMRTKWEAQNQKLWTVNETLREDLAGHQKSLDDERETASRREAELTKHAEEALKIEQANKAREIEEAKAREGLARDVKELKSEVEGLQARLTSETGAHETTKATVEDLRSQLALLTEKSLGQADTIADLRGDLERHASETLAIEKAGAERTAQEQQARAELTRELERQSAEGEQLKGRLTAEQDAHETTKATVEDLRGQLAQLTEKSLGQADTIAALRADLERHAEESLAIEKATSAREAEEAKVRAELERELTGYKAELSKLEGMLDTQRGAVEERAAHEADARAQMEARLSELGAFLEREQAAAHEARSRTEAEAARAEEQAREAAARGEVIGTLEADLDGHRAVVSELRAETERLNAELAGALRTIDEQNERMTRMRAELRDRVKGLKRAFGPKFEG